MGCGLEPFGRAGLLERRSLRNSAFHALWGFVGTSDFTVEAEAKNFNGEVREGRLERYGNRLPRSGIPEDGGAVLWPVRGSVFLALWSILIQSGYW